MKDLTITVNAELTFVVKGVPEDHDIPELLRTGQPMVTEDEAATEMAAMVLELLQEELDELNRNPDPDVDMTIGLATSATASYSDSYPVPAGHELLGL